MRTKAFLLTIVALLTSGLVVTRPILAQNPSPKTSAIPQIVSITDLFGTVEKRMPSGEYRPVQLAEYLSGQTTIRTGEDSAVLLQLPTHTYLNHHSYLRIGAKSVVVFENTPRGACSCKVLSGQVWSVVHPNSVSALLTIRTPSAITYSGGVWGVGYDVESDQTIISSEKGTVLAGVPSGIWQAPIRAGQTMRYSRRPQINVRSQPPVATPQTPEQKAMWKLLNAENWIALYPRADAKTTLNRGNENKLRGMLNTVQIGESEK